MPSSVLESSQRGEKGDEGEGGEVGEKHALYDRLSSLPSRWRSSKFPESRSAFVTSEEMYLQQELFKGRALVQRDTRANRSFDQTALLDRLQLMYTYENCEEIWNEKILHASGHERNENTAGRTESSVGRFPQKHCKFGLHERQIVVPDVGKTTLE